MVWQFSKAVLGEPYLSRTDGRGDSECILYVLESWNTTVRVKTLSLSPQLPVCSQQIPALMSIALKKM